MWDCVWRDTHEYFLLFRVSFFLHSKIKYEGPNGLFIFFFYFRCCTVILLLLINISFILIIIYLYFFFSYFLFVLIGLYFGVIPSSKINIYLDSATGGSGGAHLVFYFINSWFYFNGKYSGNFFKGWQLNCVIHFFFIFI
jgi:hypothetical protein